MKKFCFVLCFFISFLTSIEGQVRIICKTDTLWIAGQYNRVSVDLMFDYPDGIVRFTQDFPEGLEVVPENIPSGDFSWYSNQLNIVWLNIPASKKISFSYLVMPGKSMSGTFDLEGRLVMVTGGKTKRTFGMENIPVTISDARNSDHVAGDEGNRRIIQSVKEQASPETYGRPSVPDEGKIEFRVQVASYSKPIPAEQVAKKLGLGSDVKLIMVRAENVYRYQAGSFSGYEEALALHRRLVSSGLKDSFVVAYNGEKQIPLGEAIRIIKSRR